LQQAFLDVNEKLNTEIFRFEPYNLITA